MALQQIIQKAVASPTKLSGLELARLTAPVLAVLLWVRAGLALGLGMFSGWSFPLYFGFTVIYGAALLFPWESLEGRRWRTGLLLITACTVVFVLGTMFQVMVNYYEILSEGRKPGIPGFEGMLVFLALFQPPTLFFSRRPDLLN